MTLMPQEFQLMATNFDCRVSPDHIAFLTYPPPLGARSLGEFGS